ncbi:TetR/AcrR family transcriptional regulator [Sphingomonas crocodyli]|uniref:TetR/AcrR family transcriptional regulator n=1 Tax=Sphingomonas crocodyli TaxID=1979270 RepID=A0A437M8Y7_9SPHN|nr:TetR/AcrR family transcriptional regulator [Sphingomonas crocodyli]RVT94180.1 TetR/AcrR family transcriptional regulator [Sphingomonas crocodyli]
MGERPTSRRGAYASAAMIDRRARILRETRRLIAEDGAPALRLSDVAETAGVAINTLYGLFGRREDLIAHAVLDGFATEIGAEDTARYSLTANLQRLRRTADYFRGRRNELAGLVSIYFSATTSTKIRSLIDDGARRANAGWVRANIEGLGSVDPPRLTEALTRWEFATLFDWSIDRLSDIEAPTELAQGHLRLLLAFSRGELSDQIARHLSGRGHDAPSPIPARVLRSSPLPHALSAGA